MKKIIFILCIILTLPFKLCAQNPIVPAGIYIADPSAHVWKDGKLYIYGSLDESTDYYCSWRHHVLSTSNMKNWILHENVFASKGPGDEVPESDDLLFAPDYQFKDGTYYLYYCLPGKRFTEGVASSPNPAGPFVNGQHIKLYGYNQIDPCVFIDDDGQTYYIWGQFSAKMAKLKPDMKKIDETTIRDNILTEKEHFFHEGGYMVKRNDIYYFVYAHMGRSGMPTCIGYATSHTPMGPYTYGGVIIDNDNCNPGNWNNHGSIVEFNGQWYVFYHRSTHSSRMMRKTCVEPIIFNKDGSIDEVEMTSQGAGGPLNALSKIDAERACLLFGNVRIQAFTSDNEELGGIKDGDRTAYKYINFGDGADQVTFRVKPGKNSGKIALVPDMQWHRAVGTAEIPAKKGDNDWQNVTIPVEKIKGVHALWLKFSGEGDNLFSIDWFKFTKGES